MKHFKAAFCKCVDDCIYPAFCLLLLFICLFIYRLFVVNNDTPTYLRFLITLYLSVL